MPFVYIVRCANGAFYTGWTTDLDRRIAQHNAGRGGAYTRRHRPVTLVYREEVADRSAALRREAAIKQYDRQGKERLINATAPDEALRAAHGLPGGRPGVAAARRIALAPDDQAATHEADHPDPVL